MNVAERIKAERLKNNWTQEELAMRLNVSRSAVSSWEVGRNYPDLETIVALSNLFELSLDDLLKGDVSTVEKISCDTKQRKLQSKQIKLLKMGLVLLLMIVLLGGYYSIKDQNIQATKQIKSVEVLDNRVIVKTKLPFYRSVGAWSGGMYSEDNGILEIGIISSIDWSLAHNEKVIIDLEKGEDFDNIKEVRIISPKGNVLASSQLK